LHQLLLQLLQALHNTLLQQRALLLEALLQLHGQRCGFALLPCKLRVCASVVCKCVLQIRV
jgi:ubiquinone biosynthesis protein UbiJ